MHSPLYVPLRVHGHHSLLTGIDSPAELLERASELGIGALALADIDTTAGHVEFIEAAEALAQKNPARAVRPILGAEISPAPVPSDANSKALASDEAPGRLIALVETARGYQNLNKLVSARHLGGDPGDPEARLEGPESFKRVESAVRFQAGLIYIVDHPRLALALAGRVPAEQLFVGISPASLQKQIRAPLKRRSQQPSASRAPASRAIHPQPGESRNVYHTSAPPREAAVRASTEADDFDTSGSYKVPPPPRAVSAFDLLQVARATGLATLALPDIYYALPGGLSDHRVRVAIKHNALLYDLPEDWVAEAPAHILSPAEAGALYTELPEVSGPFAASAPPSHHGALARTLEVAERCQYLPKLGGVVFPNIQLDADDSPYSRLVSLSFDGARERYRPLHQQVIRRLDYELSVIDELGFAAYFLLVRQIRDFASEQKIPCVGRGSAADSLVAYCLGLTDADPLRYRLPFERFLNPARKDRPDIDLDFCWRRRDEILEHVYEAFGPERTAMISTLNRFGLRSAFREAALVEGVPPVEVNRWSRQLPWAESNAAAFDGDKADDKADDKPSAPASHSENDSLAPALRNNPIARAFLAVPESRDFPFEDERYQRVLASAARLVGTPRHFGLHPGGVVATPGPITDWVACHRAAKGVIVTQHDKDGVEALGLVKMDLLGNRALTTVIDDCHPLLFRSAASKCPTWLCDLPRTMRARPTSAARGPLARLLPGRVAGYAQPAAADRRLHTMDDVIQAVALIRPGTGGLRHEGRLRAAFPRPRTARSTAPTASPNCSGTRTASCSTRRT